MLNALSIDLEDWFHAELVRSRLGTSRPERRVHWAVEPILTLLQRYHVRATFFVLGDVLQHHPDLVRRIHEEGHEIGSHGWSHRPLWTLDRERFAWELEEFDREIGAIVPPESVVGFRAPTFSLDERTHWALPILRAHGYRYDSSIFPLRTYLYGVTDCPPGPYHPTEDQLTEDHPGVSFLEFPLSAYRLAGFNVPVCGGFYLRAMPLALLRHLLGRINAAGYPTVIYLHPWEADVGTPRITGLSPMTRFVTYYNARSVLYKLEALLQSFSFAPLVEVLGVEATRSLPERPT